MSNFKAIAATTASLRTILDRVKQEVNATDIISLPPDRVTVDNNERLLNIYLYEIVKNHGFTAYEQPHRNSLGQFIHRPTIALDLRYALTAYTNNEEIISHQILGSAIRILNENPILTKNIINLAIQANPADELTDSDLANQIESVKISPYAISLDEISKLWSSFFHSGYRTSIFYQATVVMIESDISQTSAIPVIERNVNAVTMVHPELEKTEKANV